MIQSTTANTLRVVAKPNNREQSSNDTPRSRSVLATKAMPRTTGLMPVIQGLTEQLSQEKPQNKASKPAQSLIYQPRNTITGTDDDDKLRGSRGHDRIEGLAGNDRLSGRQGNDVLNGGAGNDHLYGGKGNDFLNGGTGNDYLSGGRGNNHLNGGAGDDTLASRLGNDVLNGGQGNDTARIRGDLDDYIITQRPSPFPIPLQGSVGVDSIFPQPLPFPLPIPLPVPVDSVTLIHKKTGQTINATNIEKFRFNDARLSFDELIKQAGGSNETKLDLSAKQHAAIAKRFNRTPPPNTADGLTTRYTGMAIDKDGDNKLSVGDVVKLRDTGGIAGIDQSRDHVLTVDDIKYLSEPHQGEELSLTREQQNRTLDLFNFGLRVGGEHAKILDSNGDGKISKGDVAVHLITELAPTQELGRLTLTEEQAAFISGAANIEAQKDLDTSNAKWADSGITDYTYEFQRSCFCLPDITRPVDIEVKKSKVANARYSDDQQPLNAGSESNKQSITDLFAFIQTSIDNGRQVEVEYDKTNGSPKSIVIDRDQMPVDGGQTITVSKLQTSKPIDSELKLTDVQHKAIAQHLDIRFSRSFERQYLNSATDKDGNGRLSTGDTVKLLERQLTPVEFERIVDYVLTPRDIAVITGDIGIGYPIPSVDVSR